MIYKNKAFRITMNVIMVLLTLCCILPFILLIASSFSSEADLTKYGYSFIPRGFTLAAYKYIWAIKENILRAYGMSFLITGIGTVINLVMTLLFAYPLSRKDLPGRKWISFFLFFTMLFNGGFVPTYLIYSNVFHITDTLAAMIVPYLLMNAFYVIMMRTYIMTNVPMEVIEASMIDGANEFQIYWRIVMPLVKPAWLTLIILFFQQLWNNDGGSFIYSEQLKPLSYSLNQIVSGGVARTGTASAVMLIMMIVPITVFVLSQSQIIETMAHSGMK